MRFKHLVTIYMTLIIARSVTLAANEFGKNEFCVASKQEEAQCGAYTYKVIKPLLDYFKKIHSPNTNNDNLFESKNREISELQVKVIELQQKESDHVQSIELYKDLVHSKSAHIQVLENNNSILQATIKQLTKSFELITSKLDQLTDHSETLKEKEKKILELTSQINSSIEKTQNCENKVKERDLIAKNHSDHLAELNTKITANSEIIVDQNSQISKFKSQIESDGKRIQICESQLASKKVSFKEKIELISNLETQTKNMARSLNESLVKLEDCEESNLVDSCIPFGTSPGVHKIKVPGFDSFKVLCANAATGPGWIVIQQRINGKEDFYRDFATYKAGFGSFDGDFFLGLENIHRLTAKQQHEVYIHLEEFNGRKSYALYDNFTIAAEVDQYKLISVGDCSGNTSKSYFSSNVNAKFHTFDRDNSHGCATNRHGGWWYFDKICSYNNLNGKYFDHQLYDVTSINWYDDYSLKKVQMAIRPKF